MISPMPGRLHDKTAIVTGAGQCIGSNGQGHTPADKPQRRDGCGRASVCELDCTRRREMLKLT